MKEYTIKLTGEQLEELLHMTSVAYMEYDERSFADAEVQRKYNESVMSYNNKIDEIRKILKEAIKNGTK